MTFPDEFVEQVGIEPYYKDEHGVIYCGDCLEIMPKMPPLNLILTDPPWKLANKKPVGEYPLIIPGSERAIELWTEATRSMRAQRLAVWLPAYSDPREFLNPLHDWPYLRLVYIRRAIPGYFGRVLLDGEIVHVLGQWPKPRTGRMVIPGGLMITYRANDRVDSHPCPRSLIATNWLVKWWSEKGDIVLDPFAGSGTTAVAAKQLGRRYVGIEIVEDYCKIVVDRLRQGELALQ